MTSAQSLPPGARIRRHRHLLDQIVYPSSGAVSVTTPAGTWITPANRAIWIPAGVWHEHRFHGHTQFHGWATPSAFIDTYRRAFGRTPGARRP